MDLHARHLDSYSYGCRYVSSFAVTDMFITLTKPTDTVTDTDNPPLIRTFSDTDTDMAPPYPNFFGYGYGYGAISVSYPIRSSLDFYTQEFRFDQEC